MFITCSQLSIGRAAPFGTPLHTTYCHLVPSYQPSSITLSVPSYEHLQIERRSSKKPELTMDARISQLQPLAATLKDCVPYYEVQSKETSISSRITKLVRIHRKDPFAGPVSAARKRNKYKTPARVESSQKSPVNGRSKEEMIYYKWYLMVRTKNKKNMLNVKTRQISLMDESKRKLRFEEFYPWVIEDYDGKNIYG